MQGRTRDRLCGGGVARRGVAAALAAALTLGVAPGTSGHALADMLIETGMNDQEATASAQPSAAELSAQAIDRFQVQDYDAAVRLFEEAYAIDRVPNYLFNIGRVYEEKGDLETALTYYERFVAHPEAAPDAKRMTEARIEELRAKLPPPSPDPIEPPPPRPRASDTSPRTNDLSLADTPAPARAPRGNLRLRIGGYSLLGGGAAILAIGAGFAGAALAQHRRLDGLTMLEARDDAIRRGEQSSLIADSLFIAGGVVAIAGLTLTLVSLRSRTPAPARTP